MDLKDLKKNLLVTNEGHFMPLVFVEMGIPAAIIAMGAKNVYTEASKEIKTNRFDSVPLSIVGQYVPICVNKGDLSMLALSIDDIKY